MLLGGGGLSRALQPTGEKNNTHTSPPPAHPKKHQTKVLEAAAANGVPVSPSMTGPHAAELQTQLEVFFKQHKYPENKAFVLCV